MKKLYSALTALLFCATVFSQNIQWAKSMGGTSEDYGSSITLDASGNVYTIGWFEGTVDFDPGTGTFNLVSAGSADIFIQKLDASGNFIWAKSMGGAFYDVGTSITLDGSGNVYTTGFFYGTADFDPGVGDYNLVSAGSADIFIQKSDASGNFIWAKRMGGTSDDYGYSITLDASGNVYTTGLFVGTADFDPGAGGYNLVSAGYDDIFIQKLDASGNFGWAKSMGGASFEYGRSITLDASGNVYTTGRFEGTADFDPGAGTFNLVSAGGYDIFIQKLNASGNFLWAKRIGGTSSDLGFSITLDASANVYTTGYFTDTADFDPGTGTFNLVGAGGIDIFIQKLDASGNFIWAKRMGGTSDDVGRSITLDASGNVYTTGSFIDTADFDPGAGTFNLVSAGGYDIFIQKLNASGNFIWAKSMGGASSDDGNSITIDGSGNVYTTGEFYGTVDFDPGIGSVNLTSVGGLDIFIAKYDQNGTGINETSLENLISIFPNPSTGKFQVSSSGFQVKEIEVYNMYGEKIYTSKLNVHDTQIDISAFSEGIYFVQVKGGDNIIFQKLIVE